MADSTETETAGQRSKRLRHELHRQWRECCTALAAYSGHDWSGRLPRLVSSAEDMERLVGQGRVPEELLEPVILEMQEALKELAMATSILRAVNPPAETGPERAMRVLKGVA